MIFLFSEGQKLAFASEGKSKNQSIALAIVKGFNLATIPQKDHGVQRSNPFNDYKEKRSNFFKDHGVQRSNSATRRI